ncbi:MAG TPA: tyrosine-type recombinase/integrase, partial [Candidatus Dormibacteraeota bacterium]|nr:tyrosine-type recombinase/integrase [Candidatus Dormibacteraeota bacterium]
RSTLGRPRRDFSIPLPKAAKRLPQILSREEVARVPEGTPNLKHRVLLMTTYAAGLRVSEVVRLRVSDIDSQRMLLRVEQGKGMKDRYTLLSPRLRTEVRRYYRVYRPTEWLFADRRRNAPMDPRSALTHCWPSPGGLSAVSRREPEELIRSELFSIERLEQHAARLAAAQPVTAKPGRGRPLATRLRDNGRVLLGAYRAIGAATREERAITPAAEWLVDNFHIAEEQISRDPR